MEEPITTLVGGRRASDRAVNALLRLLLVLNQLALPELSRTKKKISAPRLQRRPCITCIGHFECEMLDPLGCEESSQCVLRVRDTLCSIALRPIALLCDE